MGQRGLAGKSRFYHFRDKFRRKCFGMSVSAKEKRLQQSLFLSMRKWIPVGESEKNQLSIDKVPTWQRKKIEQMLDIELSEPNPQHTHTPQQNKKKQKTKCQGRKQTDQLCGKGNKMAPAFLSQGKINSSCSSLGIIDGNLWNLWQWSPPHSK